MGFCSLTEGKLPVTPPQLIARLKREVQMLTEELELLRGEQRQELLSPQQVTRCTVTTATK